MIYAVVNTDTMPIHIGETVQTLARKLASKGAVLRTSVNQSDHWQIEGALGGRGSVARFLPWDGYGQHYVHNGCMVINQSLAKNTAKRYIKGFRHLKPHQQLVVAATVPVLLGEDGRQPCDFVFIHAPKTMNDHRVLTLTMKLAVSYSIRVYNLANDAHLAKVKNWI
ncbi:hypothetical protein [Enterovibrio norvegicus]|uniref:hypothetical protein n=1 Tax=Enterovibrio norvegicus TaxID=188144 RepID=UPI000C85E9E1|nr:hypothetical protein [Enterovibrio norvegicus]PMH64546.1 hypothetical protein BCU62_15945 [Enterovibrio norvegicus]